MNKSNYFIFNKFFNKEFSLNFYKFLLNFYKSDLFINDYYLLQLKFYIFINIFYKYIYKNYVYNFLLYYFIFKLLNKLKFNNKLISIFKIYFLIFQDFPKSFFVKNFISLFKYNDKLMIDKNLNHYYISEKFFNSNNTYYMYNSLNKKFINYYLYDLKPYCLDYSIHNNRISIMVNLSNFGYSSTYGLYKYSRYTSSLKPVHFKDIIRIKYFKLLWLLKSLFFTLFRRNFIFSKFNKISYHFIYLIINYLKYWKTLRLPRKKIIKKFFNNRLVKRFDPPNNNNYYFFFYNILDKNNNIINLISKIKLLLNSFNKFLLFLPKVLYSFFNFRFNFFNYLFIFLKINNFIFFNNIDNMKQFLYYEKSLFFNIIIKYSYFFYLKIKKILILKKKKMKFNDKILWNNYLLKCLIYIPHKNYIKDIFNKLKFFDNVFIIDVKDLDRGYLVYLKLQLFNLNKFNLKAFNLLKCLKNIVYLDNFEMLIFKSFFNHLFRSNDNLFNSLSFGLNLKYKTFCDILFEEAPFRFVYNVKKYNKDKNKYIMRNLNRYKNKFFKKFYVFSSITKSFLKHLLFFKGKDISFTDKNVSPVLKYHFRFYKMNKFRIMDKSSVIYNNMYFIGRKHSSYKLYKEFKELYINRLNNDKYLKNFNNYFKYNNKKLTSKNKFKKEKNNKDLIRYNPNFLHLNDEFLLKRHLNFYKNNKNRYGDNFRHNNRRRHNNRYYDNNVNRYGDNFGSNNKRYDNNVNRYGDNFGHNNKSYDNNVNHNHNNKRYDNNVNHNHNNNKRHDNNVNQNHRHNNNKRHDNNVNHNYNNKRHDNNNKRHDNNNKRHDNNVNRYGDNFGSNNKSYDNNVNHNHNNKRHDNNVNPNHRHNNNVNPNHNNKRHDNNVNLNHRHNNSVNHNNNNKRHDNNVDHNNNKRYDNNVNPNYNNNKRHDNNVNHNNNNKRHDNNVNHNYNNKRHDNNVNPNYNNKRHDNNVNHNNKRHDNNVNHNHNNKRHDNNVNPNYNNQRHDNNVNHNHNNKRHDNNVNHNHNNKRHDNNVNHNNNSRGNSNNSSNSNNKRHDNNITFKQGKRFFSTSKLIFNKHKFKYGKLNKVIDNLKLNIYKNNYKYKIKMKKIKLQKNKYKTYKINVLTSIVNKNISTNKNIDKKLNLNKNKAFKKEFSIINNKFLLKKKYYKMFLQKHKRDAKKKKKKSLNYLILKKQYEKIKLIDPFKKVIHFNRKNEYFNNYIPNIKSKFIFKNNYFYKLNNKQNLDGIFRVKNNNYLQIDLASLSKVHIFYFLSIFRYLNINLKFSAAYDFCIFFCVIFNIKLKYLNIIIKYFYLLINKFNLELLYFNSCGIISIIQFICSSFEKFKKRFYYQFIEKKKEIILIKPPRQTIYLMSKDIKPLLLNTRSLLRLKKYWYKQALYSNLKDIQGNSVFFPKRRFRTLYVNEYIAEKGFETIMSNKIFFCYLYRVWYNKDIIEYLYNRIYSILRKNQRYFWKRRRFNKLSIFNWSFFSFLKVRFYILDQYPFLRHKFMDALLFARDRLTLGNKYYLQNNSAKEKNEYKNLCLRRRKKIFKKKNTYKNYFFFTKKQKKNKMLLLFKQILVNNYILKEKEIKMLRKKKIFFNYFNIKEKEIKVKIKNRPVFSTIRNKFSYNITNTTKFQDKGFRENMDYLFNAEMPKPLGKSRLVHNHFVKKANYVNVPFKKNNNYSLLDKSCDTRLRKYSKRSYSTLKLVKADSLNFHLFFDIMSDEFLDEPSFTCLSTFLCRPLRVFPFLYKYNLYYNLHLYYFFCKIFLLHSIVIDYLLFDIKTNILMFANSYFFSILELFIRKRFFFRPWSLLIFKEPKVLKFHKYVMKIDIYSFVFLRYLLEYFRVFKYNEYISNHIMVHNNMDLLYFLLAKCPSYMFTMTVFYRYRYYLAYNQFLIFKIYYNYEDKIGYSQLYVEKYFYTYCIFYLNFYKFYFMFTYIQFIISFLNGYFHMDLGNYGIYLNYCVFFDGNAYLQRANVMNIFDVYCITRIWNDVYGDNYSYFNFYYIYFKFLICHYYLNSINFNSFWLNVLFSKKKYLKQYFYYDIVVMFVVNYIDMSIFNNLFEFEFYTVKQIVHYLSKKIFKKRFSFKDVSSKTYFIELKNHMDLFIWELYNLAQIQNSYFPFLRDIASYLNKTNIDYSLDVLYRKFFFVIDNLSFVVLSEAFFLIRGFMYYKFSLDFFFKFIERLFIFEFLKILGFWTLLQFIIRFAHFNYFIVRFLKLRIIAASKLVIIDNTFI